MAKKVVGRVRSGAGKTMTRCIKMVRSEKSGAYTFKEDVILNEDVKKFFTEKQ
jgi:ABC-type methionine transport system ATPase subunit